MKEEGGEKTRRRTINATLETGREREKKRKFPDKKKRKKIASDYVCMR